jgi:hypothetical protein
VDELARPHAALNIASVVGQDRGGLSGVGGDDLVDDLGDVGADDVGPGA